MLNYTLFDTLRFLARDDLDTCQLASKSTQDFIERSPTFALRSIFGVKVVSGHGHFFLFHLFRAVSVPLCSIFDTVRTASWSRGIKSPTKFINSKKDLYFRKTTEYTQCSEFACKTCLSPYCTVVLAPRLR